VIAGYYANAIRLAGEMRPGVTASHFQSLEWTQARFWAFHADALEGLARNDLPAAMVIVRERALNGLKAPS
jgi:hypothetical protein